MYRSKDGGLSYDEDNLSLDPVELEERLHRLCYHHGDSRDLFVYGLYFDTDFDAELYDVDKMLMSLCRYGRQSLEYWEEQPITRLVAYVEILGELIREEKEKATNTPENDYT